MARYDDLYLRDTLTDTGNIPRQGAICSSPDIIPWGLSPQPDPQAFFSTNYDQDVGRPLIANVTNYLYIRAKNLGSTPSTGKAYLYWSPSSLLLYPSQWKGNQIGTLSGADSVTLEDVAPGAIGVTEDAYVWTPHTPGGYFHYCLIGRVVTAKHPNSIPDTDDINDFATWVAETGGISWRNVSVVDPSAPRLTLEANYDQGDTLGEVAFTATCVGCPLNQSWVQFSSATTLPNGQYVGIGKTLIDREGMAIGVKQQVPAGWKTTFIINYWSNAKPLKGWNINVTCALTLDPSQRALYKLAHTAEELGWANAIHEEKDCLRTMMVQALGPKKLIVVGQAVMVNGQGL